ncbi:DNA-binding SARP family transcriptional activator/tetratricopeptide (TPR) repeat protein [Streptomyces sp. PvR006]|uniref:AfsR/SARP family transcriptional regulator n=1 Tax=unclassified Streptomyces TaxID=2593676 RepID=UPI001AE12DA9|nr:BTAD domain-containing putative transcriptional regulator [Streptomyces sp. PvR006]MBP2584474.1 DNA-binding SARP family transcriptional activator/tetratricopeptide (TPR) repeat protein [Streptomyces sp. PvR006]
MEFRLLGSVALVTEDGDVALGPAKRSSLLVMLLLRPNSAVNVGQLIDALWEEEPPTHAKTVLQGHVSRLRALLAEHGAEAYGVELATQGSAYVLRMPESLVDAHRFEELVALAGVQRRPADAVRMLREALSYWQGPALTGTVHSRPLEAAAGGLEELRLASVESLAEAYGELGEHARAAAVLRTEAVAHPLRESLAAALMLALGRSGRQSDAIDWYHRTRRLLAEELGVDPGETLSEAYATLLRSAEPVTVPRPAAPVVVPTPEGLPRAPRGFTGRGPELAALDRAVRGGDGPVCLVTGPAGVGKTAFAVHWAYERRSDFPDGRLFADLRGFSDTPAPETAGVLREFLLALGVQPQRIPEAVEARGALFRSLTADRRLLVVLDNARSSEQVRPLLPGGDHCTTLVTSRDRLGGLIASDAARPVPLGHLPPAASAALLTTVLGETRVAAEPAAAARLAGLCDGLPLALRVTAARLAERPGWTLDAMVGELADEQSRLMLLDVEDRGVSAALHLTVQQLPDSAARLFRAIGLHTGSDLDRFAAAALVGTSPVQASADLDRLSAAHLLTEPVPGRWMPHDLVRLYARHLAEDADPEGLRRLIDHYLYTGLAADAAAEPGSQPCYSLPADVRRPAAVLEFEDRTAALDWYVAERAALGGAVTAAAALGLHDRAWRLALVLWPLMLMRIGDGWTPLLEAGLASAEHMGDFDAQSRTRALLGWILHEEGRDTEALVHLEKAPGLAARAGDMISEAIAYVNHAAVLDATGEHERAGLLMAHAVSLADRTGHPSTQVLTLHHLAGHCMKAGDYEAALAHTLRAGELVPPEAVVVQAQLQIVKGEALAGIGRVDEAADQLERAIAASDAAGFTEGSVRAAARLSRLSADR